MQRATRFIRFVMLVTPCLLVAANVHAQQRGWAAWTQWSPDNSVSGATVEKARDNDNSTFYSTSSYSTSYNANADYYFWWGNGATPTEPTTYFTYVPRIYSGAAIHVPAQIRISYHNCGQPWNSAGCQWTPLKTVDLPEKLDAAGYTIALTPTITNGLRIEALVMRVNPSVAGDYRFQIASAWAGNGDSESPSKTLTFPAAGAVCDVYGYSKQTAMVNASDQLAYDFNVSSLAPDYSGTYAAVFHAEPYKSNPATQIGDSVGVSYNTNPRSLFPRASGTADLIVTRTSNASTFMSSGLFNGSFRSMLEHSGGGNPILVRSGGTGSPNAWTLFWLSVKDRDETGAQATSSSDLAPNSAARTLWRHFLHVAQPSNVSAMTNTTWNALAQVNGVDAWQSISGNLKNQSYEPWPVRRWTPSTSDPDFNKLVHGDYIIGSSVTYGPECTTSTRCDTQGLIGNVSYNADKSKLFFFGIEGYPTSLSPSPYQVAPKTVRREFYDTSIMNYMRWKDSGGNPLSTPILNGWVGKIAYYDIPGVGGRWIGLSTCSMGTHLDLCLAVTPGGTDNPSEFTNFMDVLDSAGLGPFFDDPFADPNAGRTYADDGGIFHQPGILKNAYGQIQTVSDGTASSGSFIVYIGERPRVGGLPSLFGTTISSIKIRCHQ